MKLQGNTILIKADDLPEKSKGGISIPRTATEKPYTGVVINHGPLCNLVLIGSRVQFKRKSASVYIDNGEEYFFTHENNLLYVYPE